MKPSNGWRYPLVGGIGHHPGALPGRDHAALTEPASSHTKRLTARRACAKRPPRQPRRSLPGFACITPALAGGATTVPEAQRSGRVIPVLLRDAVLGSTLPSRPKNLKQAFANIIELAHFILLFTVYQSIKPFETYYWNLIIANRYRIAI